MPRPDATEAPAYHSGLWPVTAHVYAPSCLLSWSVASGGHGAVPCISAGLLFGAEQAIWAVFRSYFAENSDRS